MANRQRGQKPKASEGAAAALRAASNEKSTNHRARDGKRVDMRVRLDGMGISHQSAHGALGAASLAEGRKIFPMGQTGGITGCGAGSRGTAGIIIIKQSRIVHERSDWRRNRRAGHSQYKELPSKGATRLRVKGRRYFYLSYKKNARKKWQNPWEKCAESRGRTNPQPAVYSAPADTECVFKFGRELLHGGGDFAGLLHQGLQHFLGHLWFMANEFGRRHYEREMIVDVVTQGGKLQIQVLDLLDAELDWLAGHTHDLRWAGNGAKARRFRRQ
jgi:hypothetical protein